MGKTASDFIATARKYIGIKEGSREHHYIVDRYNSQKPIPNGYKVSYSDPWCATFTSFLAVENKATSICPVSAYCPDIVNKAIKMGIWEEDDSVVPQPGWLVLYDWGDGSNYEKTDNRGLPDHIGIVEAVRNGTIIVIEGNKNDRVERRMLRINGRFIRGFVKVKYSGSSGKTSTAANKTPQKLYRVQAATFTSKQETKAKALCETLTASGIESYYYKTKDGKWFVVQVGAFTKKRGAQDMIRKLKKLGIEGMIW